MFVQEFHHIGKSLQTYLIQIIDRILKLCSEWTKHFYVNSETLSFSVLVTLFVSFARTKHANNVFFCFGYSFVIPNALQYG